MRSQFCSQRPLDSRSAQQSACSCSYQIQPFRSARSDRRSHLGASWEALGRRPSSACGAYGRVAPSSLEFLESPLHCRHRRDQLRCSSASEPDAGGPESVISGYTPANYISFSDNKKDVATHTYVIDVDASPSICFNIWNDWNRLVEFLDLIAQIGLDVNNLDLALFQCFYRHGLLPVMEIVFVLQKTEVIVDKRIAFESVWGMPMSGSVTFEPLHDGKTSVKLTFSQALPDLLVDLKVGIFGVQNSLMPIFSENLLAFRSIAEAEARDPSSLPPRAEAGERGYVLFDEDADLAEFVDIMDNLEFDEEEELVMHAREESERQKKLGRSRRSSGRRPGFRLRRGPAGNENLGFVEDEGAQGRDYPVVSPGSSSHGGTVEDASASGLAAGDRRTSSPVARSAAASQGVEQAPRGAAGDERPSTAGKGASSGVGRESVSNHSSDRTAVSRTRTSGGTEGARRQTARAREVS